MSPGAVVIGAHLNGLGVIRALGARGVRIVSVSTRPFDVAQHSRFVAERVFLPTLHTHPESLVDLLERRAGDWHGAVVLPTNDDALTVLAHHHDRLSRSYRLAVGPWEQMQPLIEKDRMHALAEQVGLDLPRCFGPATFEAAAGPELSFPVLVKPIQHDRLISLHQTKLFLARDRAELDAALAALRGAGLRGLLSEFVPGPDRNLLVYAVYLDRHGEPSPGVTLRKLRQHPPVIGGGRVVQPVGEQDELREATIALLRRVGFRGMAFAEFKWDPRTGRHRFIEVNGRAVLFNGVLPPTGLDLVAMTWSDFGLGEPCRPRLTGWRGAWIHLQADLLCAVRHRREEGLSLRELVAPYRGAVRFGDWSAADPKPFLVQSSLAGRALVRGFAGGSGPLNRLRPRVERPPDPLPDATPRT